MVGLIGAARLLDVGRPEQIGERGPQQLLAPYRTAATVGTVSLSCRLRGLVHHRAQLRLATRCRPARQRAAQRLGRAARASGDVPAGAEQVRQPLTRPAPRRAAAAGTTAWRRARRTPAGRRAGRRRGPGRRRSPEQHRQQRPLQDGAAATGRTSAPRCAAARGPDRRTRAPRADARPRPGSGAAPPVGTRATASSSGR